MNDSLPHCSPQYIVLWCMLSSRRSLTVYCGDVLPGVEVLYDRSNFYLSRVQRREATFGL
jgi:hypothetical protein